jgi:hypothetical protein
MLYLLQGAVVIFVCFLDSLRAIIAYFFGLAL